jgi:Flp pilus assembly protein TadD
MPSPTDRLTGLVLAFEVANAAYLAAYDSATIFYHAMVVAHVAAGAILVLLLAWRGLPRLRRALAPARGGAGRILAAVAAMATLLAIATAVRLAFVGTATPYRALLQVHIASACAAVAAAALAWLLAPVSVLTARRAVVLLVIAGLFPLAVRGYDRLWPEHVARIENPTTPPLGPDQEGGGPNGAFFPSSVTTVGNRLVPDDFFLESKACGNTGCHPDITRQWTSSMHHFSSFNNQWYRKSIEYMQDVVGTRPSKWCGGCHDQSVLLTGRMDRPIKEQIDTPQAQAGIGCLVCHSIVHVKDTMGQGGYVLEYPEMHRLVASHNPALHLMHDYMVRLDPGPHKATMLKPFHRESRAEFCSACHKVHLDVPVNHYRWFRGFNEYDAWQGSGVSGQGARAFYYPDKPKDCADCHMPLVASQDAANVNGLVHSHRFPAANTAVPYVNGDQEQLKATQDFLRANIVSVDVFAVTASAGESTVAASAGQGSGADEPVAQAMFPDLDAALPAGGAVGGATPRAAVVAPLDRAAAFIRPGAVYRVDVVARTRGVGHFFPGGTVDAFDVWLELKGTDARGRVFYWSGYVENDGHGPVEAGAHRYRSLQVDAHGNPINKRNAWSTRALVYAHLIPPGAADVARFRVAVPKDAQGPLTFTARMNYRKFSWWNTQFSFAGVRDPEAPAASLAPGFDDARMLFTGDTSHVSGPVKAIPDPPITIVAENKVEVPLDDGRGAGVLADLKAAVPQGQPFDRERWNDYGIGLLLEGDLAGARAAFERVTLLEPAYAAGWVNLGRVLVQEGEHEKAMQVIGEGLKRDPRLASGHYFMALALKSRGRYDEALDHLRQAAEPFPRDRAVRNQIGRLLFLKRQHREAIAEFEKTLAVDPEDLTAHYNLMLCYRALGDADAEKREETLYTRFKADEASQALTGAYRRLNPEDNIERQPIHEHVSRFTAPAPGVSGPPTRVAARRAAPTSRASAAAAGAGGKR